MQTSELSKFDKLKADVAIFAKPVLSLTVTDKESADTVLAVAREVKSWTKKVEDRRKELVAPLNEQVKLINSYAKDISKPLDEADTHLRSILVSWERILEKQRLEELRKAEEEKRRLAREAQERLKAQQELRAMESMFAESNEGDTVRAEVEAQVESERAAAEIMVQHRQTVSQIQSNKVAGTRKVMKFEVLEPHRVPPEFMVPDEKKIRAAVAGGALEISGVRIWEETAISIR